MTDEPLPVAPALKGAELAAALEAVLMVVDQPASTTDLAIALGVPAHLAERALEGLALEYRGALGSRPRGFELRQVAGGWRVYSHPDYAAVVERFVRDGATAKLTMAALETLAIVAYKGPISRGRISAVRGVNVESVMRTLVNRGLVEEAGLEESSGAVLYATTELFLERMGMASLAELEPLEPHLPRGAALEEIRQQVEP
ncbi:MAG: SMC-Scp complex subunit ScpB [Bifidobacteriaceae bacterium]|jgi:segregation and condensation protein B|nr:SMC-Scp complex subunit ScpB [Bifidobacteriaceae bacterium]